METKETFVVSVFSDAYGIIWHLMQFVTFEKSVYQFSKQLYYQTKARKIIRNKKQIYASNVYSIN